MSPETLEAIFVQREAMAQRLVELIRESALTPNKHHTLLTGPRGIGKTHLVSLVCHRLRKMESLREHLLIAWLNEEEWGIDSFFELVRRILRALAAEYEDAALAERIEGLYSLPPDEVGRVAADLLIEYVRGRSLLVLIENLDDVFDGLKDEGQKRLRSFLQENPFCAILATAQSLFGGVSLQTSPFYGFFRHYDLEGLSPEQAVELLAKIAQARGDAELEQFVRTPAGRARLRAVRHLAGGNHRVYIILSQFLTRESLDELVEPVMQMLDDLTPYYQSRMQQLVPGQRKIVEFLCERQHAERNVEIAARCFLSPEAAAFGIKSLLEKGYLKAELAEGETFYEIREPLMRLCLEVKKQRGEPIRLFVDFLRLWYSQEELKERLEKSPEIGLERGYLLQAIRLPHTGSDEVVNACLKDFNVSFGKGDIEEALAAAEDLVVTRGTAEDWLMRGACLEKVSRHEEALTTFEHAVQRGPDSASAWLMLGNTLRNLWQWEAACYAGKRVVELDPQSSAAYGIMGVSLAILGRKEEARASALLRCGMQPTFWEAWSDYSYILAHEEAFDESLAAAQKAIDLEPKQPLVWARKGKALLEHRTV